MSNINIENIFGKPLKKLRKSYPFVSIDFNVATGEIYIFGQPHQSNHVSLINQRQKGTSAQKIWPISRMRKI